MNKGKKTKQIQIEKNNSKTIFAHTNKLQWLHKLT